MVFKVGLCLSFILAAVSSMASNLNLTLSIQDENSGQSYISLSLIMKDELLKEAFDDFLEEMNLCKVENVNYNCPNLVWNSQGLVQDGWTPAPCSYYDPMCLQQVGDFLVKFLVKLRYFMTFYYLVF